MNDLKNSETVKNLMRAFAGESQARNRYTFAAAQAKKEHLHVVEAVFNYTADQERQHAYIFYQHLKEMAGETIESVVDIRLISRIRLKNYFMRHSTMNMKRRMMCISLLVTWQKKKDLWKLHPLFIRLRK